VPLWELPYVSPTLASAVARMRWPSRSSDTLGTELFPVQSRLDQFHSGFWISDPDD
jgi:hypothetical protein